MSRWNLLGNTILFLLPAILVYLLLFRRRLRFNPGALLSVAAVITVLTVGVTLFMHSPMNPIQDWTLIYSLVYMSAIFLVCCVITKCAPCKILFVLLLLCCFTDDVDLLCITSERILYRLAPGLDREIAFLAAHAVILALSLPALWGFVRLRLRPMIEFQEALSYWRVLWLIPASYYVLYRVCIVPGVWTPEMELDSIGILSAAWIGGTVLTLYIIPCMLSDTVRNVELREKLRMSDYQLTLQKERYELLWKSQETTRRIEHDMRHHLFALQGYLDVRNCEGMLRYIRQNMSAFQREEQPAVCTNAAVDAISRHYAGLIREGGAAVSLHIELPEELPVSEGDVCVVLGNLLENAAEACARPAQSAGERFVNARAVVMGKAVVIQVKNSYGGEIRRCDGAFLSSKRAGEGIGIASVRAVAHRHSGYASFEYEEGVFTARVLLNPS